MHISMHAILNVLSKVTDLIQVRQKKLKKTKGVTVGALCKVLGFPRWVYFSTGRAGFRSRRDVSEDRAANRANTHTNGGAHAHILTCIWDVQPCTKKKRETQMRAHTHTLVYARDRLVEALVFRAASLPLAGSLSTAAHYTVPEDGELCTRQNMSGEIIRETMPNKY